MYYESSPNLMDVIKEAVQCGINSPHHTQIIALVKYFFRTFTPYFLLVKLIIKIYGEVEIKAAAGLLCSGVW